MRWESAITCPKCGFQATETMPADACQYLYDCKGCGQVIRPKQGDCCVFCSYGTTPCPPKQLELSGPWFSVLWSGKTGRCSIARLAQQLSKLQYRVVPTPCTFSSRPISQLAAANGPLGWGIDMDGRSLPHQCAKERTHTLPVHWTLLSCDDFARSHLWYGVCQSGELARIGCGDRCWEQVSLVGNRTCLGAVFLAYSY